MTKMGLQETIAWYEKNAEDYDSKTLGKEDVGRLDRFAELLTTGAKVLDAGCASGRDSSLLSERGLSVVGVDITHALINIAKVKHPECEFVQGDILQLPFRDSEFEGVWSQASLLHLETIEDVKKHFKNFIVFSE